MTKLLHIIRKYKEIILLFLLSLLLFHKYILYPLNVIYPSGDIWGQYYLWKWLIVTNVKDGILPLWNPYSFSGMPLQANPLTGMFYPSIIFFFLLPITHAFEYLFILDFFLIGLFTYLFSRSIQMTKLSSFISASVFMLSGSLVTRVFAGHFANIETIVWLPTVLYLFEKGYASRKAFFIILLSVAICMMILAGHSQFMFYSITTYLLYVIARIVLTQKRHMKDFLLLGIIPIIIGSLLSSIQLLPSFELSHYAIRSGGVTYAFASSFSLHPLQLITFFLPHFYGGPTPDYYWGKGNFWELCGYMGIVPLLFAFYSLHTIKKNKFILIFLLLALFSLLFSLGKYFIVFPIFYYLVPLFNLFRIPATFLFVYSFAVSILCGFGIEHLLTKKYPQKFTRTTILLTVLLLIISLSGIIILTYGKELITPLMVLHLNKYFSHGVPINIITNFIVKDLTVFISFLTGFLLTVFLIVRKGNITLIRVLIAIITIGNVYVFSQSLISTNDYSSFISTPSYMSLMNKDYRVYNHIDTSVPALLALNNVKSILGSDPSYLSFYRDFMWTTGSHLDEKYEPFIDMHSLTNITPIQLLNTKYLVTNDKFSSENMGPLNKEAPYIYQLPTPYSYAYIVPNAHIEKNEGKRLTLISKNIFNFKDSVLVEKKLSTPLNNSQKYMPVTTKKYTPNEIQLVLPSHNAGYLVISEIWYPGWNAYIDGKRTEILKANEVLRAIYLSANAKTVIYKFEPLSLRVGMILSATTLLLSICFLITLKKKRTLF